MRGIFQRQLAEYANYHRDQRNCLMHIVGNPILFVAAVLPLSLLSVTVFGVQTSAAVLLVIPALILWISWDIGLGLAIVVAAIPLLFIATIIAKSCKRGRGLDDHRFIDRHRLGLADCRSSIF